MPNLKLNFEFFGEMFGYPDPSRRFTMGLGSIVYDVIDDYFGDGIDVINDSDRLYGKRRITTDISHS